MYNPLPTYQHSNNVKKIKRNMKVEVKENQIILKEVYNSITLETIKGKQLHICMRDMGFEMKIDDGNWHLLTNESDFLNKAIDMNYNEPDYPTAQDE